MFTTAASVPASLSTTTSARYENLATRQDGLATKENVAELVTRFEILAARQDGLATKAEVAELAVRQETLATREDAAELGARQETLATKAEVADLKTEVAVIEARVGLMLWLSPMVGGGVLFLVVRAVWPG